MQLKDKFRYLVIFSYVTGMIGLFYDFIFSSNLPPAIHAAISENILNTGSNPIFDIGTLLIGLTVSLATTIGMCNFRQWSRRLCLYMVPVGVFFSVLAEPIVLSGIGHSFIYLAYMTSGASIAIAYFEPTINNQFISAKTVF
ncbi:hypothetical protein [Undibacterium sp. TC9W]|uniref:hypothetical protein n=1 Tax=Undibacterium sp. TC9W TaxID=3413053 RepID=UPI003BF04943